MLHATIRTLLFIGLAVVSAIAAAEDSADFIDPICQHKDEKNANVAGRAQYVEFPNGRKITIVGHQSNDRKIREVVNMFRAGEIQAMTDEEFSLFLTKILRENAVEVGSASPIKHAVKDYAYLKELLGKPEAKIGFISHEGPKDSLDRAPVNFRVAKDRLLYQYKNRAAGGQLKVTPNEMMDILLGSMGANAYVFAEDPALELKVDRVVTSDSPSYDEMSISRVFEAEEIAALNKTGVHFVEINRLNSSVNMLERVCTAEVVSERRLVEIQRNRLLEQRRLTTESGRIIQ